MQMKIERYIPIVSAAGFVGLVVSLFLLSDYSEPLMNLAGEYVKHFSK